MCIAALFAAGDLPAFGQNAGFITTFDPANVLQQRNQMAYELFLGEKSRGPIIVFSHLSGLFVPAETLLSRLGYAYHYDADDQLLQIDFKDKTSLTIRFRKREYIRDGDTDELDDTDFILKGYNVYLSARFLNKTFPVGFSVDQAARKLRVIGAEAVSEPRPREPEKKEETKKEKEAEKDEEPPAAPPSPPPKKEPEEVEKKEQDKPLPETAPVRPVIVDDILLRKIATDDVTGEPFAEDVLRYSYGVLVPALRPVYPPAPPPSTIKAAAAPEPQKPVETAKPSQKETPAVREDVRIVDGEPGKPFATETKTAETPSQPAPPEHKKVPPEAKTAETLPQAAVAGPEEEKPTEAKKAEEPEGGEEKNILVLQPRIKRNPPSELFLEAFEIGETAYLPFAEIMKLLEFDIRTDEEKGTAEGTFVTPDRTFSLDLNAQEARVNGQTFALGKDGALRHDNKLFVKASLFKEWFDVACGIDKKMMYLTIDTMSPLPMEMRLERHKLWDKLMARQKASKTDYQNVETPYEMADWPFVDVTTSHSFSHKSRNRSGESPNAYLGDYSILGSGDLGYLTTNVYATGTSNSPLNNLRLTAGRKDPNAALLGPLAATSFSFGDIDSPALTYATTNTLGRGVAVSNRAVNAPDSFDTHTFTGNATPGWEVELYRNNLLIGFQTADANGRYEFKDVPLIYGNNTFRTVLYGPQGQQEEKVENFSVGQSMLKPGQFEYSFSVNEEGETLTGVGDANNNGLMPHGLRGVAEVRYGLADYLSVGTGVAQVGLRDGDHRYMSALADTSLAGVITEANFVKDTNGGWLAGLTALTSVEDIGLRARHIHYRNFVSAAEHDFDIPRKTISAFDMNSQFYVPLIEDFNFGASVKRETFETQVPRMTYGASFSKAFWGMSFSNTMDYIMDTQKRFRGILGWQTKLWNILFRMDGNYEIKPDPGVNSAGLTAQYWLDRDLSAQTKINQQLGESRQAGVSQTFNWDLKDYRLSFSGEMTDNMEAMAGVSLVFSLGRDKLFNRWHTKSAGLADAGAVSGRVFADDNYNGAYDEGEKLYPEATMRINALSRQAMEDNSFLAPIAPYDPVDVDLDINSLKDPMLSPSVNGYRITTRPGSVVSLDFPIISTSEVDGNVVLLDDKDGKYEFPDIVVHLNNKEGYTFKSAISESDGYFLFSKVPPGDYTIAVPTEALAQYGAEQREPVAIRIEKTSDFVTGKNVILHLKGEPPATLKKAKR